MDHRDSREQVITTYGGPNDKYSKTCCCHVVTGAAVVGLLQLLVVTYSLATSGIMLDRWRLWESYEKTDAEQLPTTTGMAIIATSFLPNVTSDSPNVFHSQWSEALAEFMLTMHVTFCVIWLLTIVFYALAFRYFRSYMIVPNLTVLCVAAFFTFVMCGVMIAFLCDSSRDYQKDEYEESFMIYSVTFLLLWWLVCLSFIYIVWKFYKWILSDVRGAEHLPIAEEHYDDHDGEFVRNNQTPQQHY